ncbi:hypothetical protein [Sporichthya brevicatena]|uniref:hypothetical protein n=1 Tax=Sporichthya brevicatena TaxID=171442 RepID=UPI0031E237FF
MSGSIRPGRVPVAAAAVALVVGIVGGLGAGTVSARARSEPAPAADPTRPVSDWAEARVTCRFQQVGDPVRLTGAPGSVAVARGTWRPGTCPVPQAKVKVRLQARHDGDWYDIEDTAGLVRSGTRVQATFDCHNTLATKWRSVVDVDLPDAADDPQQLITPARTLKCCPDPAELRRSRRA